MTLMVGLYGLPSLSVPLLMASFLASCSILLVVTTSVDLILLMLFMGSCSNLVMPKPGSPGL